MQSKNLFRLSALLPLLVLCSADVHPGHIRSLGVTHLPTTSVLQPIGDIGDSEELFLITSLEQYQQLFGEDARGVDFRRDWAFLYSAGIEPSGGYEALVTDVAYTPEVNSLVITTSLVSPGMNCGVPQIVTHPYTLVRFPKPNGPVGMVRLQKDDEVLDCP
jgi:PrcB C-terminal